MPNGQNTALKQTQGGRPPKYRSATALQRKIDQYFTEGCSEREIIIGAGTNQRIVKAKVPTISELVLYCGFSNRGSFYDYGKNPLFSNTINKANMRMQAHYERLLQTGNPTGAIFALKNFGWIDKADQDREIGDITININAYKVEGEREKLKAPITLPEESVKVENTPK